MNHNYILSINDSIILNEKEYEIIECIGYGASSKVYKAIELTTLYPVLIKELFPTDTKNLEWKITRNEKKDLQIPEEYKKDFNDLKERTNREVNLLQDLRIEKINENGIININNNSWFQKYHGPYEANNTLYTVIDSNSGDTLSYIISDKNKYFKDFTEVCECILRILEALEPMHIHERHYLHLDISPDNIYVLKQEIDGKRIYNLIDFNSAYSLKSVEQSDILFTHKEGYSAPELKNIGSPLDIKEDDLTYATDLYSVAAIFFEILVGRLPEHIDMKHFSRGENVINKGYLENLSESLIKNINQIVKKGLSSKNVRYQTIEEMRRDIKELIKLSSKKELKNTAHFNPAYGNFVGRKRELQEIYEILSKEKYIFLYGIGGIGKSELAKKYAETFRDKYDIIQLVNFNDNLKHTVTLNLEFHNFDMQYYSRVYKPEEIEHYLFRDKMKIISESNEKTLIIIDNYNINDDENFWGFIEGNYNVIFTTRNKHEQNEIEIKEMDNDEDLLNLFYKNYGREDIAEDDKIYIKKLIDLVGGHTLTIELIAKTMQKSRKSPRYLFELMNEKFDPSLREKIKMVKDNSTKEAVLYEHILNLFNITEISKDAKSTDIMVNMSLIPYTGIAIKIFHDWLELQDYNDIEDLISQGWIKHDMKSDIISLHPMISEVIAHELKPDSVKCDKVIDGMIELVRKQGNKPYVKLEQDISMLKLSYERRIKDETERYANLCSTIAELYCKLSCYKSAVECCHKALAIFKKILGTDDTETAASYNNIGSAYYNLGIYNNALENFNESLAEFKKSFVVEHTETATSYNNIGSGYDHFGEYNKALEFYNKALAIQEKVLRVEDKDTATSYDNIGLVYVQFGEHNKALEFYNKALAIREKVLGVVHKDTATSYHHIFLVYPHFREWGIALEFADKALVIQEKVFGLEHLEHADISYIRIGSIYNRLGEHSKALEYYYKVLAIYEKKLGTENTDTATLYIYIGSTYNRLGEHDKALKYYYKALAIYEKKLRTENTDTATSYDDIGSVYYFLREYDKTLEYYFKALAIQEKVLGIEHRSTAESYNNIGSVYNRLGKYDKTLEYYFKSLAIQEKVFGLETTFTVNSYNSIGSVYNRLSKYDKALEYQHKALAMVEKRFGTENTFTATSYNNICSVYNNLGEYDKALEYQHKALAIFEKVLGTENTFTATSYNNIGSVYNNLGEYDKALEFYYKALAIREKALETENTSTATSCSNIGCSYSMWKNYTNSCYHLKALEIKKKLFADNDKTIMESYKRIGDTYKDSGNFNNTLKYYIDATINPTDEINKIYEAVSEIYDILGDTEKANDYRLKIK